jgi:probable metal-binding protein
MEKTIHGHEVMRMMLQSGKAYSRNSLKTEIINTFGAQVRFHTCSADNMNADELIDFLEARGKFLDKEEGFTTDPGRICNH